jgi:hypothetical protein
MPQFEVTSTSSTFRERRSDQPDKDLHHIPQLVDATLRLVDSSALEPNVALHAIEFPSRDVVELRSRFFGHPPGDYPETQWSRFGICTVSHKRK